MSGKSEGDAFKAVDDAMSGLDSGAQQRLLDWANAKFGDVSVTARSTAKGPGAASAKTAAKAPGAKKSKTILKQVKDLDLRPKGKQSAIEFVKEKSPSNLKQKCTVAVYYVSNVLDIGQVGLAHVYTFFKEVGWPLPSDLPNTLHQTGTEGWLDTSNAEDLKVTTRGENLIEHDLPGEGITE